MKGDKKGIWCTFETGEASNIISMIKKDIV
jgi:hypothetical protein